MIILKKEYIWENNNTFTVEYLSEWNYLKSRIYLNNNNNNNYLNNNNNYLNNINNHLNNNNYYLNNYYFKEHLTNYVFIKNIFLINND